MIHLFMKLHETFSIGDAFMITAAITIGVIALITMAWYAADCNRLKIKLWFWKLLIRIAEDFEKWNFLSLVDEDDDPVMPSEYASWASAEKWRQTCIKPKDRRM